MTDGSSALPLVSVAMLTFNHERFIRQAVGSVLCQKSNFEFEIVISDDRSTDTTPEILRELQADSAGRIRLLHHDSRLGVNRNLLETLNACRGKYISLLEGDDFWLAKEKLATQIVFLESHPECSSVHHNVFRQVDDDTESRSLMHKSRPRSMPLREVLRENPVATCSVVFRNEFPNGLPGWLLDAAMPDWCLHVLNAQSGQLGYIDQPWAVYRQHSTSYWSQRPRSEHIAGQIKTATILLECLDEPMQACLRETIRNWHEENVELLIRDRKHEEAHLYAGENLSDEAVLTRLSQFYQSLEYEQSGRKLRAAKGFFETLFTSPARTRIRTRDILLALFRSICPNFIYCSVRTLWRILHSPFG